ATVPPAERESRRRDEDSIAAPDPLEHASADADLAEVSERTGLSDDSVDGTGEVYEDEVTPDEEEPSEEAAIRPAQRRRAEATAGAEAPRRGGNRFINFLRACVIE